MNFLEKICKIKQKEIESLKKYYSIESFLSLERVIKKNGFFSCLMKDKINLIAEIKKKSPSAGLIKSNFDIIKIANAYKNAGAECLSILTENKFFGGKIEFIDKVKKKVDIPVLRKDFIIDEWQIYESFYYGADCILLIAAILDDKQIVKYTKIAKSLKLDVILEVHDEIETNRAIDLGADCIGINNRNLKTLQVNIDNFEILSKNIPKNVIKIAESGLTKNEQLLELKKKGADAFLVGEFLIKQENILKSTRELIQYNE